MFEELMAVLHVGEVTVQGFMIWRMLVADRERRRMLRIQEALLFKMLDVTPIPDDPSITDLLGVGR